MLIIADENIPLVTEAFAGFGEVRTLMGRKIKPADVKDAGVLLVRSVSQVNEQLLDGSNVRFVGSATIGTDHVDLDWLHSQGIQFANAPGCNAVSAAEYVMAALLELNRSSKRPLADKTLGIIGCGNVGSRVQKRAEALGMQCLICDPPRAEREGRQDFVSMEDMAQADIVTVHVPLVKIGPYATRQLIGEDFLRQLSPAALFINTSRGDVVDEVSLKHKLESCPDFQCVLDVWENEPLIDMGLANKTAIATPHIAGYSTDGKVRATRQLYEAYRQHVHQGETRSDWAMLPPPEQPCISLSKGLDTQTCLKSALRRVYDIHKDDDDLRRTFAGEPAERAAAFDQLRKRYRVRRECSAFQVPRDGLGPQLCAALDAFGFRP